MKQRGFTLIELLLATAMFSFILLFVTAAFVQVSRAYNKGITVKRTQETARAVTQELVRAIGTSTSGTSNTDANIIFDDSGSRKRLCVGTNLRFAWNEGFRGSTGPGREGYSDTNRDFAMVRTAGSTANCSDGVTEADSVELIDPRLTIRDIDINQRGSIYTLCVMVSSNTSGDFSNPSGTISCTNPPNCNPASGDTYCDIARLETTVTLRR